MNISDYLEKKEIRTDSDTLKVIKCVVMTANALMPLYKSCVINTLIYADERTSCVRCKYYTLNGECVLASRLAPLA